MRHRGFLEGDPRAASAGRKGGQVSGENRKAKREQAWVDQGIDPRLAERIRRDGYVAGYARGRMARAMRGALPPGTSPSKRIER